MGTTTGKIVGFGYGSQFFGTKEAADLINKHIVVLHNYKMVGREPPLTKATNMDAIVKMPGELEPFILLDAELEIG